MHAVYGGGGGGGGVCACVCVYVGTEDRECKHVPCRSLSGAAQAGICTGPG